MPTWTAREYCKRRNHRLWGKDSIIQYLTTVLQDTAPTLKKTCKAIKHHQIKMLFNGRIETKDLLTITQFLPMWTYDPICAALTTQSSSMNTWSPICKGKKATLMYTEQEKLNHTNSISEKTEMFYIKPAALLTLCWISWTEVWSHSDF